MYSICYVEESRPPLWSNGQCSWLQIQRSGFDSQRYQIFWEVVGPLSLVSTTEELLERKSSGSCLASQEYGHRDPSRWPRGTLYPQKNCTNFAVKWWSLGRYSSLADSGYELFLLRVSKIRYHCPEEEPAATNGKLKILIQVLQKILHPVPNKDNACRTEVLTAEVMNVVVL
jgi:hypothetical protein